MTFAWWSFILLSTAAVVYLSAFVLPQYFLRTEYIIVASPDRGLKSFKESEGRTIVYEPKSDYREYISQYILSSRNGQRVLLAKVNGVRRLDYDVVLFNRFNKVFRVLNVRESIEDATTLELQLPKRTAYVALIVNNADGVKLPDAKIKKPPAASFALFAVVVTLLLVVQSFLIKYCLANLFADVFIETFMYSFANISITLLLAFVAAAVNLAVVFLSISHRLKVGAK